MQFKDIIGQQEIKRRLTQLVATGKLPHALLLTGKEGVGKLALALATAQYLCCTNRTEQDSCGACPSCVKFAKMEHPDLHLVFPIVAEKSKGIQVCDDVVKPFRKAVLENPYLSIDSWINSISEGKSGMIYKQESEEIIRKLSLKSYESEYKTMIIWLPEKMNEESANKLLKILEEPFDKTHFILVSNDPDRIIGTIISRTQQVVIPPIENEKIAFMLTRDYQLQEQEQEYVVRLAQGSKSKAMALVEGQNNRERYFKLFVEMMRSAYVLDIKNIKSFAESVSSLNREQQKGFLQKSQQLVRENFISRCRQPELNYMQADEAAFATRFSAFIHEKNIEQIMEILALAEAQIEQNVNGRFVFYDVALQLYFQLRIPN